jgi:hypothetical protein
MISRKLVQSILLVSLLLTLSGCSFPFIRSEALDYGNLEPLLRLSDEEYALHLKSLGRVYLKEPGVKVGSLSQRSVRYLEGLHKKLVKNNELILNREIHPVFYILKEDRPFFFSLPGGEFYFSSGYILRFIQNEDLLMANLTHESIRSHRAIYEKKALVPKGYVELERILALTRIPLEIRQEVNRLSFFVMRRSGLDPSSILNWLQLINKNSLAFSHQLGDPRLISREEFHFKNFLSSQNITEIDYIGRESNSSSEFYTLMSEIRRL